MSRKPFNAQDGFTLVEAMMALGVLAMALGACILSFSMAMRTVNTASNQMAALHCSRTAMEALRTNRFSSAALTAGARTFTNATGTSFSCPYTVTNINASTKNITVSMPYLNRIRGGYSTNTLTTSLVTTLHQ